MRIKTILIICVLTSWGFFLTDSVHAAPKKSAKTKGSQSKPEKPFDVTANVFSRQSTNDAISIYRALLSKKSELDKNEYESTEEYEARRQKLCEKTLVGNLKFCDTVGFYSNMDIRYNYDADKKAMTVTLPLAGESIDISSIKVGRKQYVGTNAFGVKANVTADEYMSFAISMRRDAPKVASDGIVKLKYALYYDEFYRQRRFIDFEIPMAPAEAKELSNNGGIVIIGTLYAPYIDNYKSHSKPTIDKTKEIINRYNYVVINPVEIWIVNEKTGKIYRKESVDLKENDYTRNTFITKPIEALHKNQSVQ